MVPNFCRRLLAGIFSVGVFAWLPAQASKTGVSVESTPKTEVASQGMTVFGKVPSDTDQIVILAESAKVRIIRKTGAPGISVASNCPRNWNLNGATVRQAGFSNPRGGVGMMADQLGSRAIVNGKVYLLPTGSISGLKMNKEGVMVGGQKVEPLKGADMPGTCEGPDAVEVIVPEKFSGNLMLGVGNGSEIQIDSWKGGKLELTMLGNSTLSTGPLTALNKAVVDMRNGKAQIADLTAKVLVANVVGTGSLTITKGSAGMSNATVTGDGSITMNGDYKNLKKDIQGKGTIKVN